MDIEIIRKKLLTLDDNQESFDFHADDEVSLNLYLKLIGKDSESPYHPASTLILLVKAETNDSWNIILTKRAKHLKHHPGEISFPGGRFESLDKSLEKTAKRETFEEIGIPESQILLLGKLPQQKTISNYLVTPYVGVLNNRTPLQIDKNEVESAFEIPLSFAIDKRNHLLETHSVASHDFSFYVITYENKRIWGATARMLVNLSRLLTQ
jgi:8-oxo-dGTP pyrophosphatase MutT (NUDIX family)